jgi:hypothetical protein
MKGVLCVLLLLLLQPAFLRAGYAQTYAPAAMSASQILQKASDAAGDLQTGAYVLVEHYHGGGLDTIETTHERGEDWVEVDKTGPFTASEGMYRGQRWDRDENGIVTLDSGFHAKVDPNVLAWEHPGDPQYNVRVLGLTQSDPAEYVLEANPPGGSDQYRYYDAKSYHLVKSVMFAKDRYRHVTTYSDYRTVFGQTRWFHWSYSDGRPQNDSTDDVVSLSAFSVRCQSARFAADARAARRRRTTRAGLDRKHAGVVPGRYRRLQLHALRELSAQTSQRGNDRR